MQYTGEMSAETINMRTDPDRKRRLQQAADLSHESLTSFVLSAAEERAEQVLAAHHTTALPIAFFDTFFDALAPEPAPALSEAAARLPATVRRGG
jgi:uncharacterized protein (DUF1778 family)